VVATALERFLGTLRAESVTAGRRIETAPAHFEKRGFARRDCLREFPNLSPPPPAAT
jgi:hypothetical protein